MDWMMVWELFDFLLGHGRVSQKVQRCIPSKVNHFNWKIGRNMRIIRGEVTYEHCFSIFFFGFVISRDELKRDEIDCFPLEWKLCMNI